MMKMKQWLLTLLSIQLIMLTGCRDNPEPPEAAASAMLPSSFSDIHMKTATKRTDELTMSVHHFIKDGKLYVECIVSPNFEFLSKTGKNEEGKGYIELLVNGKKVDEFTQGAFIVKNLNKGKHNIKLKLLRLDGKEYGITKDFTISIP
ncbi:MAG: hypothetical protein LPK00_07265 [Bacillaceae bacterium]|nr:hypothetical protein [Bacillaceae bacterium]